MQYSKNYGSHLYLFDISLLLSLFSSIWIHSQLFMGNKLKNPVLKGRYYWLLEILRWPKGFIPISILISDWITLYMNPLSSFWQAVNYSVSISREVILLLPKKALTLRMFYFTFSHTLSSCPFAFWHYVSSVIPLCFFIQSSQSHLLCSHCVNALQGSGDTKIITLLCPRASHSIMETWTAREINYHKYSTCYVAGRE